MKALTVFHSPETDPCINLALEEHLFLTLPKEGSVLLLWQNRPSVVLGRFQNAASEVDLAEAAKRGICVVRRLSGGGAVYHDPGNLNYSLILRCEDPVQDDLEHLTQPVVRAFRRFGADAVFSGRNDIYAGGKKLSGSAQYARDGKLLHHGCILVDTDLSVLPAVLRPKPGKLPQGVERSAVSPVTTLSLAAGRRIDPSDLAKALAEEFGAAGPVRSTEDLLENDAVVRLKARYEDPAWTYGWPPSYEETKECRFPGGLVRAHLRMEEGCIAQIAFSGDFFCTGDLQALCALLQGRLIDDALLRLLQGSSAARCIRGVSPDDLYRLIAG